MGRVTVWHPSEVARVVTWCVLQGSRITAQFAGTVRPSLFAGICMDECEFLVLWFKASESLPFFVTPFKILSLIIVQYGRIVSTRTGRWKKCGCSFVVWGVWKMTSTGRGVKSSSTCWTWGKKYVQGFSYQSVCILHLHWEVLHDRGHKKCLGSWRVCMSNR